MPAYISHVLLLYNKSFFHKKKYGQNICICFNLGGSKEHHPWNFRNLEPPQKIDKTNWL